MQKLELTWIGKGEQPHLEPRLLLLQPEHCYGDPQSENMLIHGDNLLALKALEQQYTGKVKCIYIDPPYNTGHAFEHYDDMMEHSVWLNLMFQRLVILRNLLSPDGTIWISIDDDECHYLKVLCDEVFGRKNFINNIVWQKKYGPANDAKWLSDSHEHILLFAKNKDIWRPNLLIRTENQLKDYKNPDNDPRGRWRASDMSVKTPSASCMYPITGPDGAVHHPPPSTSWRFSKERFEELLSDNRIWFGIKGTGRPMQKKFLTEVRDGITIQTWWDRTFAGDNKIAKYESKDLFINNPFATPKPESLLEKIIQISTKEGDIVFDSFLGSGTASAVAHKMGRRWIGIELGEHAYTHCVPRLVKVVNGTDQGGISKAVDWQGGGGFKTYTLAPSLLKADEQDVLRFNPDFTDDMIAQAVAKIEGFTWQPDAEVFWKQSQSSEHDYLLVTKIFVTREWLAQLHEQMAEQESLLICCPAFGDGCESAFDNITLKKIPNAFMKKYAFDKNDYSLNVSNVLPEQDDDNFDIEEEIKETTSKPKKVKSAAPSVSPGLFDRLE